MEGMIPDREIVLGLEIETLEDELENEREKVKRLNKARQDLLAEKLAAIDCINLYGDSVLHKALDDAGIMLNVESKQAVRP